MKKTLKITTCFFITLITSCQPYHDMPAGDYQYLAGIHNTIDLRLDDLFDSFGVEDYPEITSKLEYIVFSRNFRVVVITYHTTDPLGNPVIADGTLYYPLDCDIRGVVEMSGIAHMNKNSGSSENIPALEALPVLAGYAVILPDMIGYGKYGNTKQMPHPFMMCDNLGKVAWDMRLAATEYFRTIGYDIPRHTIISGYSYGGGVGLAVARYYQERHRNQVYVERVVVGGGACDLNATFRGFADNPICTYPLLPGIIMSLDYYYNLDLDYKMIFKSPLADHYAIWYDRTRNASGLLSLIGEDMRNYMHPDFFKPVEERNAEFQKLQPILDMNSAVDGWVPYMPIYLYHSTQDQYVPIAAAEYAYSQFKKKGAYIVYKSGKGSHADWGVKTFAALLLHLAIK
ncbi:MAG: alpha/beta fold hydrolase [Bacteroidales bacterium]|jgi:pimeloyl-ACP methyl ester carboxylesterase|nr:alpha/beta fold hydrolase [Bacteroidales bacterium]MDD2263673.1 alpha/beta fold hydrolase [Bacteroidales bacterium]MDD2830536.1 alpha/beta fold hydrolase [Bacteroidales bacterium]MDD3208805.1 alpha/beta fold hydrolase [Bacteroidales bacterium]MDD3697470.1 alpha/beta fold hydrolase [Bacteroidales bacterium]